MRAVDAMSPFIDRGEEVVVQHGLTDPDGRPGVTWRKFMEHDELMLNISSARGFFCHAGVGSVITSLMQEVTPVVIPREARFGEHIDDHQLDLAPRLEERGLVVVLPHGETDVETAVLRAQATTAHGAAHQRGQALVTAVGNIVRRKAAKG